MQDLHRLSGGSDFCEDSESTPKRDKVRNNRESDSVSELAHAATVALSNHDIAAEWPPQLRGRKSLQAVRSPPTGPEFTTRVQRAYVASALRHPDVRTLMCGL